MCFQRLGQQNNFRSLSKTPGPAIRLSSAERPCDADGQQSNKRLIFPLSCPVCPVPQMGLRTKSTGSNVVRALWPCLRWHSLMILSHHFHREKKREREREGERGGNADPKTDCEEGYAITHMKNTIWFDCDFTLRCQRVQMKKPSPQSDSLERSPGWDSALPPG